MGGHDVVRPVEAKYPALLFRQQLTAYVEKIYGIIRDNLKKELSSFLSSCIQVEDLLLAFPDFLRFKTFFLLFLKDIKDRLLPL